MGLFKPDPPQPPNPAATAAAQTGTNVSTGVANAFLNNVNQVTPQGNLTYDVTGNYSWTDPSTGTAYNLPRFTATQTQTPMARDIEAQNNAAKLNLATMGNQQSGRVQSLLSQPFNPTGGPAAGDASAITGIPQAATTFGDAGAIRRSYGPQDNFSADRQRVENALMDRMNPQLARERGNIEQRLADQGIRYGSQAYASAMDDYNRQANDARLGAISTAGDEQQRLSQMAGAQAMFENNAQNQLYQQLAQRGTFQNAGLAQQLGQAQSGFNASNAARNQFMQEQYQLRNQPINEIAALMSGSQVQNPNWLNTPQSQIATTDFAGITNQNFQNQLGIWNTQNQNAQQLMGGILGLGAGVIKSDRRAKKNIDRIGTVFAAKGDERKELPIYEYSYKGDRSGARHTGPMAQDVEKIDRGAVHTIDGTKYIEPARVMGGILRAS